MRTPALVIAVFALTFPAAARADVTATLTPATAFNAGDRQVGRRARDAPARTR